MITFKEYYMLEESPRDLASGIQASRNNAQMTNPSYPQGREAGVNASAAVNTPGNQQQLGFDSELNNAQSIQDPEQKRAVLQDIINRMDQEIQQVSPALAAANKNAEQGLPAGDQQDLQDRNAFLSKTRYNALNQIQQLPSTQQATQPQAAAFSPQATQPQAAAVPPQATQPQATAVAPQATQPQVAATLPVNNQVTAPTDRMARLIQQRNNRRRMTSNVAA